MDVLLFSGLAQTTIDNKGRVTVPQKFRDRLPATEDGRRLIYVVPGADYRHLDIYDLKTGKAWIAAMTGDATLSGAEQRERQQVLRWVELVEIDAQGRINLPKGHVQYAKLEGELNMAGAGNHLELYSPKEAKGENVLPPVEELDPGAIGEIFNKAARPVVAPAVAG